MKQPGGVEQAHVIDAIVHDTVKDEVILTMVERRQWDGSERQLFQLQEKFNAYVSFVLDGEMVEAYPGFAGKRARLRLECAAPPTEAVRDFLNVIHEQLEFQGIAVEGVVMGAGCGPDCGCAD